MRSILRSLMAASLTAAVLATTPTALAATARPKNATAQCKDGTYSTAKTSQGACSKHGGVAAWFGASTAAPAPPRATVPGKRGTPMPANATAQCKDGSYSAASAKLFACWGHGGIETWFADRAAVPPPMTSNAPARPAPAENAQNATARCKDGTLSFSKTHSGTCSHHGGVAQWFK